MGLISRIAVVSLISGGLFAVDNPALSPIQDDPALPRVLLVGDSISIGYTLPVRELLKGVANVHRPPVNCASSGRGLKEIDNWLGNGHWDVIHFNFGLHDALPTGQERLIRAKKYQDNIRAILMRLEQTGAKVIWASTTPLPSSVMIRDGKPIHYEEDIVAYNAAALAVMEEKHVAIDDLHAYALPRLKELQIPGDMHFTPEGYRRLAEQVAGSIRWALP